MEKLRDLNKLAKDVVKNFNDKFEANDCRIPQAFKDRVRTLKSFSIVYNDYSVIIKGDGVRSKDSYVPNQSFYMASYFIEYSYELSKYKQKILPWLSEAGVSTNELTAFFTHERDKGKEDIDKGEDKFVKILDSIGYNDPDRDFLIKFVTDYEWWSGSKTIDRSDFFNSPVLSIMGLSASSNAAMALIVDLLTQHPEYNNLLLNQIKKVKDTNTSNFSLQQIYYGAPGTGKSHEINRLTEGEEVIRTTFHPDSDYSTFVGAYKPVMEDVDVRVVPVVLNNGASFDQNNGTFKEKRISYKFVKQAFLKAYLGAWKKYVSNESANPIRPSFEVSSGIDTWVINKVDDNKVFYKKITQLDIGSYEKSVRKAWDKGLKTGNYHPSAACNWYSNNNQDEEKNADKCWEAVWNELAAGRPIRSAPGGGQEYVIALEENSIVITAEGKGDGKGAYKSAIKTQFEENDNDSDTSVQKAIAQKLREYSQDFDEAWKKLKKEVEESQTSDTNTSDSKEIPLQFLIIEEINRGNCAQIFGDLFQLLDRGNNGFSEYPIEADTDLQQEIARAFKEETEYKLARNIEVDGIVKGYKSNYGRRLSEDIQEGRILILPPNLYIWATMNTSDQSLFPIDSAFKRRWEWKYMKIKDEHKDWMVDVDLKSKDDNGNETTKKVDWWEFVDKINKIIASMTSSADKQLGYFFCKATKKANDSDPEASIITKDTFVSKVIFYLWNDVFKDYGFEDASLFRYKEVNPKTNKEEEKDLTFPDFYDETGEEVNTERLIDFIEKVLSWQQAKEEQK